MNDKAIIEMKNVNKTFKTKLRKGFFKTEKKNVEALKAVSFSIRKGEIFSLLGPNGAGKTTAIKILTTLLLPTSGTATVNGFNVEKNPEKVRASINAMLMGERSIYWKLSGRQNLEFFGTLYYQSKNQIDQQIEELTDVLELQDFLDRPVESFSSGQKYKLAFAKTMINNPPIIFLDEPTATLDPRAARTMRSVIKRVNKLGTTIFLTTHNMLEATEMSDRVAIIDLGEIIALDTPDNLRFDLSKTQHNSVNITLDSLPSDLLTSIKGTEGVLEANEIPTPKENYPIIKIITNEDQNLYKILEVLNRHKLKIIDLKTETPSLEDVFLEKTGRTLAEDTKVIVGAI